MYQCEVRDCHFEHVQVGGTTVCMAPYIELKAAEIMAEIRCARQDYHLAPFNLPQRNRVFVGRDDELSQLAIAYAHSMAERSGPSSRNENAYNAIIYLPASLELLISA